MRAPSVFSLAAVLVLGACSVFRSSGAGGPGTEVRVTNQNWQTVVVYAVSGGQRARLGMVETSRTATFQVPSRYLSPAAELRLVAQAIGSSDAYTTEPVNVGPGQRVELVVENALGQSHVTVVADGP
jgi:hypothetical protein